MTSKKDGQKAIGDAVQALAVLFGKRFTEGELKIWLKNFEHEGITPDEVRRACVYFRGNTELNFFPPFPQWVKTVRGSANHKAEAVEQWDNIIKLLESKGFAYAQQEVRLEPGSAISLALRAIGGLSALADASYEQLSYMRHTFIEAYRSKSEALALPGNKQSALPEMPKGQVEANQRNIGALVAGLGKSL